MGVVPAEVMAPPSLRQRWPVLAVVAVLIVACSVFSGWYLCALIESPIIAPQRESPALWVITVAGLWLSLTAAAWGLALIGRTAGGLQGTAWRRWRVIAMALVGSTWATTVLLYLTDPMTTRRWAIYWPLFYGQP